MDRLSERSVRRGLGPIDEELIAELIATGADEDELRAAAFWINNDDIAVRETGSFPSGRIGDIIEILQAADAFPDEAI